MTSNDTTHRNLYSMQFLMLCLSSFFFFMSFQGVLPELMIYVDEHLHAPHLTGWVLACFTLVAGLARPISGKLSDSIGRIPVLVFGVSVSILACIAYIFVDQIASLFVWLSPVIVFFSIRAFHGLSTGFKPTATAALLADILPEDRRGEGMGWLGFAGSIGMAAGPKVGNYLHLHFNYDIMFIVAALLSFVSVIAVIGLKETLPASDREPLSLSMFRISHKDVYDPHVLPAAITFIFYAASFGAVFTLIPIKTSMLGMDEHRGTFFLIYLSATALSRIIAGPVSDRVGRPPVIIVGICAVITAMIILGNATYATSLFIGGAIYGIAHGIVSPTLFAWTADLSDPKYKGRGFATMFIGMEIGIGGGALLSTWVFQQFGQSMLMAFMTMALLATIALLFVIAFRLEWLPSRLSHS